MNCIFCLFSNQGLVKKNLYLLQISKYLEESQLNKWSPNGHVICLKSFFRHCLQLIFFLEFIHYQHQKLTILNNFFLKQIFYHKEPLSYLDNINFLQESFFRSSKFQKKLKNSHFSNRNYHYYKIFRCVNS